MNCPECDSFMQTEKCRSCGWTRPTEKAKGLEWSATPLPPPSPEELAEIKRLIAETSAKLGTGAPPPREKSIEKKPRCPECVNGKFKHLGVTFCATCYGKL